jgi:D-sedoheptulose 7-phosphate isomerase
VKAAEYARNHGIFTITLTGKTGGKLAPLSDISILIPSEDTPRIQEVHMLLGHCICEIVEKNIFESE